MLPIANEPPVQQHLPKLEANPLQAIVALVEPSRVPGRDVGGLKFVALHRRPFGEHALWTQDDWPALAAGHCLVGRISKHLNGINRCSVALVEHVLRCPVLRNNPGIDIASNEIPLLD